MVTLISSWFLGWQGEHLRFFILFFQFHYAMNLSICLKEKINQIIAQHTLKQIYLWKKVVCLFCLSPWDFLNHGASCCAFGIFKSLWWARVHLVGFIMFWPTMEKSLNIEQIFIEILFELKLKIIGNFFSLKIYLNKHKNCRGIWVHF
jgi:hypothetical protein